MGKKTLNILLIFVVVGLWATVGYRFFNNLSHDSEKISEDYATNASVMVASRDTFDLQPLSRDPFLDKTGSPKPVRLTNIPRKTFNSSNVIKQKILPPLPDWPTVEYYGYIKSGASKELALLKINGKLQRTHVGEVNNNILVKKVYKDSIVLVYNKSAKTILKK